MPLNSKQILKINPKGDGVARVCDEDAQLDTDAGDDDGAAAAPPAPDALLRKLNAASIDDAADALLELLDVDGDGRVSLDEFQRGFDILSAHDQLRLRPLKGLAPHDFTGLWHAKHAAHLPGTREWAFADIAAWLDGRESTQLFWLM